MSKDVTVSLEIPLDLYYKLQRVAHDQGCTVEKLVSQVLEEELIDWSEAEKTSFPNLKETKD